jgi:hypothetical protein
MTVVLSPGTDFVATLARSDGQSWPAGTAIQLQLDAQAPLTSTITGATVNFNIADTVVDAAIALSPKKAKLYYINGATKLLWAAGPVVVQ